MDPFGFLDPFGFRVVCGAVMNACAGSERARKHACGKDAATSARIAMATEKEILKPTE